MNGKREFKRHGLAWFRDKIESVKRDIRLEQEGQNRQNRLNIYNVDLVFLVRHLLNHQKRWHGGAPRGGRNFRKKQTAAGRG